jgi:hypothetical protein
MGVGEFLITRDGAKLYFTNCSLLLIRSDVRQDFT